MCKFTHVHSSHSYMYIVINTYFKCVKFTYSCFIYMFTYIYSIFKMTHFFNKLAKMNIIRSYDICMYVVMTIVRYIYIICYTCAVKWSAEWGNYTIFFMRHQFISQIHVIKQLMPFARLYIHACTCNNCII